MSSVHIENLQNLILFPQHLYLHAISHIIAHTLIVSHVLGVANNLILHVKGEVQNPAHGLGVLSESFGHK